MKIAFAGLGVMGAPMARHLVQAGHDVVGFNRTISKAQAWAEATGGRFTKTVAEAAQAVGLELAGYTTQAHFLIGNGIGEFIANVADLDVVERVNLSRQAMLLTLPGEMGERFKAIALARGYDAPLRGFASRDLRHTL